MTRIWCPTCGKAAAQVRRSNVGELELVLNHVQAWNPDPTLKPRRRKLTTVVPMGTHTAGWRVIDCPRAGCYAPIHVDQAELLRAFAQARDLPGIHLGRADQIWQAVAFVAGLLVFWMFFRDDDTPVPTNETAQATEPAEAAAATEGISGPLNVGDEGPDVITLQERLAAEGLPVTVDGVYGQETVDAVMAFQEQEQLTVDGVVASETAEALGIWTS